MNLNPSASTPERPLRAGWFCLLTLVLFLVIGQKSFGQTMTLSAPTSGATGVDSGLAVVMSISGETGTITKVRVVMTYVSGYSTASIGSVWVLTMVSTSAAQSFSFNPSTALSSPLFASVTQTDSNGNVLNTATNPIDGVYSFYAQYTRGATGAIVRSNTANSVSIDTGALPPGFSYAPTGFFINPATDELSVGSAVSVDTSSDIITLAGHGFTTNTAVNISGTNLPVSTTYYVSVIDANTFKLATTSGGSTYADITSAGGAKISAGLLPHTLGAGIGVKISGTNLPSTTTYYASLTDSRRLKLATTPGGSTYADFSDGTSGTILSVSAPASITIDSSTDIITRANHGFATNAAVTISGTNLPASTTYYVSVLDANTFKLATTSGGSTYADISDGVSGMIGSAAVTIDPATDVITRASHGFTANTAVNISGTNLPSTTTYYIAAVTTNTFKLATTSGGTTYADFLPLSGATIRPAASSAVTTPVTINPTTDVVTLANHGLVADTAVTISGTNLSSSAVYYVSVIDANSFKLVTSSQGNIFADFSPSTFGTLTPSLGEIRALGTNQATFYCSIPESYFGSSAQITFTGHTTVVLTLVNGVREQTISIDRTNLGPGLAKASATTLPDDTYTVSFSYRDLNNHFSTPVTLTYMVYDAGTQAPSFTNLANNGAISDGSTLSYTLPEAPYGGTVKLTFSNASTTTVIPLPNTTSGTFTYSRSLYAATIPTGTYTVTLSYQDTVGNAAASTSVTGVSVTVTPFSTTDDTDGDGLNDAAEVALASLGFDWQVAQPAMVAAFLNGSKVYTQTQINTARTAGQTDVTGNPSAYSLYSLSQLQNLQVGTPIITKDTVSGKWKLTLGLQKSTDLTTYTAFPFISAGTTVNSSGQVEFLFTVPEDNAFFRLVTF